MNTKKIIALISSITVMLAGITGACIVSYADENKTEFSSDYIVSAQITDASNILSSPITETTAATTSEPAAIVETTAESMTPIDVFSIQAAAEAQNPIDVFSVYDAHQRYIEASNPESSEFIFRNGIDVSTFQKNVDWHQVKDAGYDFAIIRAGYGRDAGQVDAKFHEHMKNAKEAGLYCGAYWYSYATTPEQAVMEAEACYNTIKDYQFEYPIVFDIEDESQKHLSTATISAIIESFCSTLEDKGYYVSLYSYASFLNSNVYQSTLKKYDVWVAHYNVAKPSYTGNYGMWQYSSTGSIPGTSGNIDMDYSYKNYPYLMKEYHLNGF